MTEQAPGLIYHACVYGCACLFSVPRYFLVLGLRYGVACFAYSEQNPVPCVMESLGLDQGPAHHCYGMDFTIL